MLKNLVWSMFQNTGNIEYFMQYKEVKDKVGDFFIEAGQDNVLDDEKWRMLKQEEWSSGK